MPFSSLADPVDLNRAEDALAAVWGKIEAEIAADQRETARVRLAYIVSSFAMVALDKEDLATRALERFKANLS